MKPLSLDTTSQAQKKQFELVRNLPVWRRLALMCELIQATRKLMLVELRRRNPESSDEELRRKMISKLLTRDQVRLAYGFDPEDESY